MFNNNCNCKFAGKISGNAMCGLNERACIQTKKIHDGCIARFAGVELTVALSGITPGLTAPYNFVQILSSGETTVSNLLITPMDATRSRVTLTASVPVTVTLTDANGVVGTANGVVSVNRDIVMCLPNDSVVPYTIESTLAVSGRVGAFSADNTAVSVTACVIQVIRVATIVEILVPTYGYCEYPTCEEYGEDACRTAFNRPLFPQ
ncbi:MAG: hypothetical protein IJY70_05180 [Clostridia bacterium]|nr:hypothetical protein [Clostridia bacterium]